jgi:hypothetical protein
MDPLPDVQSGPVKRSDIAVALKGIDQRGPVRDRDLCGEDDEFKAA